MSLTHTPHEVTLSQGAHGLFIDVPDASVMYGSFVFLAGDEQVEDPSKQQVAHLVEHMVCNEPHSFTNGDEYSEEFTRLGAYTNAHTSNATIEYEFDCADMEWKRIITLIQEQLAHPKLTQEYFDIERATVREELDQYIDNDWSRMWVRTWKQFGVARVYEIDEELASLEQVTLNDAKRYYRKTHTPANLRFIIVGKLPQARRDEICRMIEGWELPTPSEGLAFVPRTLTACDNMVVVPRKTDSTVSVMCGWVIPRKLTREEHAAMRSLRRYLTGADHAKLYRRLRDEGICYSIDEDVIQHPGGFSYWTFGTTVSPKNAIRLCEVLGEELCKLIDSPLSEQEVARLKEFGRAWYQRGYQSPEEIMNAYYNEYIFNGTIGTEALEVAALQRVTSTLIRRLVVEFITSPISAFGETGKTTEATAKKHYIVMKKGISGAQP